ncbi:MAG: hypothetical protein K1X86_10335 [Ignavibacteria bacterium]|nr:hypothetical protein [Ignavibacteria bacterium]
MDSICIGLIFSDNISNSFLIDYSIKKIDKVNKIFGIKKSNLIKNYLHDLKINGITHKKLLYLSDYENGSLRFTKPEKFNIDDLQSDFKQMYSRYVNDISKDDEPKFYNKKSKVRQYFKRNIFINSKLNIGHTITQKEIGGLLFTNTEIDFIGGNGTLYCGQIIDLDMHLSTLNFNVKSTLLLYLIFEEVFGDKNLYDPNQCKIILTNLNSLDNEKERLLNSLLRWKKEKGFDVLESNNMDEIVSKVKKDLEQKDIMRYTKWIDQIKKN